MSVSAPLKAGVAAASGWFGKGRNVAGVDRLARGVEQVKAGNYWDAAKSAGGWMIGKDAYDAGHGIGAAVGTAAIRGPVLGLGMTMAGIGLDLFNPFGDFLSLDD